MITEEVLEQARNSLECRAKALDKVRFKKVVRLNFTFEEIKAEFESRGAIRRHIEQLLGEVYNSAAIYRLTVSDLNVAEELQCAFQKCKDSPDKPKLPLNNNVNGSTTVYVGSSLEIGKRLREHLYDCSESTYALKMYKWCLPDTKNNITVEVAAVCGNEKLKFKKNEEPTEESKVIKKAIKEIEYALWNCSRPMFGKMA